MPSLSPKYLVILALTAVLSGCTVSPSTPAVTLPNVTGNWEFGVELPATTPPTLPSNPVEAVFGSLTSSGSTVTGVLHARPLPSPNCVAPDTDLPATGSVDAAGNISLTAPLSGGTAAIAFSLTPVTTNTSGVTRTLPFLAGTYQVVGGPCAQPAIALNIFPVANITGTFSGTMMQIFPIPTGTAPTTAVTATFTQSATPNSDGEYALSGTITATGDCNTTITFTQGLVAGDTLQSYPTLQFGLQALPSSTNFQGAISPSTPLPSLIGTLNLPTACPGTTFNGVLNHN